MPKFVLGIAPSELWHEPVIDKFVVSVTCTLANLPVEPVNVSPLNVTW